MKHRLVKDLVLLPVFPAATFMHQTLPLCLLQDPGTDVLSSFSSFCRFVKDLPPGFHRMNEDLVNAQFPPEVQPVQV